MQPNLLEQCLARRFWIVGFAQGRQGELVFTPLHV